MIKSEKIPLVSVCVITYNQVEYIGQAVESVLSQDVNFEIEVIIGDDCSTDGTRTILDKIKQDNPEVVELNYLSTKGAGIPGKENFINTFNKCRGKYVAFLDGDDHWTDPHKLSKQIKFMEEHPEYSMCHHKCKISKDFESNVKIKAYTGKETDFYNAAQINPAFHSSVMIRRESVEKFDMNYWIGDVYMGDWPLWVLATLNSKAFFLDEEMGVYRDSREGLSSSIRYEEHLRSRIKFYKRLLELDNIDRKFLYKIISRFYLLEASNHLSNKEFNHFLSSFKNGIKYFFKGMNPGKKYNWVNRYKMMRIINNLFTGALNFIKPKRMSLKTA